MIDRDDHCMHHHQSDASPNFVLCTRKERKYVNKTYKNTTIENKEDQTNGKTEEKDRENDKENPHKEVKTVKVKQQTKIKK